MSTLNANEKELLKHFITVDEAVIELKNELKEKFNEDLFYRFLNKFLIIPVTRDDTTYIYRHDMILCNKLMRLNYNITDQEIIKYGYNGSFLVSRIKISKGTFLIYDECDNKSAVPVFVRNILYDFSENQEEQCELCQMDLLGTTIVTTDLGIRRYIENAIFRKHQLDKIKHSNFANSSSYMGSKKKIVGFVLESILPHLTDESVFLDIMCGSGAVSNALAQMGNVYASDAQDFCRLLAKIQGKGFNSDKAKLLLKNIYKDYNDNLNELQHECGSALEAEDSIFHMDLNHRQHVLESYQDFINNFELYSSTDVNSKEILDKIYPRKECNHKFPYCLFTYYFSNVYFGLAQCIQLDSIRYAIEHIEDPDEKQWALGTLVVVTSAIGTLHAGHFAQPKRLDLNSLEKIIQQREKSAWLEFSKRLISLAEESARYPYSVNLIDGPWKKALNSARERTEKKLVVYLDAPYKREEYSRYYHVLETIVKYDYPSSVLKGRIRSKSNGERFRTEFSTKTVWKVEKSFVEAITEILNKDAICAWSYSDNGEASLVKVIDQIREQIKCEVYIYGMPYEHQSQRKKQSNSRTRLKVVEYCILFIKKAV